MLLNDEYNVYKYDEVKIVDYIKKEFHSCKILIHLVTELSFVFLFCFVLVWFSTQVILIGLNLS